MAKTKLQIPDSETGYSVSTSGTIHTRHAAHAGNVQRTRTVAGVRTILDGRQGSVCQVCSFDKPGDSDGTKPESALDFTERTDTKSETEAPAPPADTSPPTDDGETKPE